MLHSKLGIPFEKIRLSQSDSDELVFGAGTGGSRDVLNSLNSDTYTSKNSCTYAACAQAYAIVPGLSSSPVAARSTRPRV